MFRECAKLFLSTERQKIQAFRKCALEIARALLEKNISCVDGKLKKKKECPRETVQQQREREIHRKR